MLFLVVAAAVWGGLGLALRLMMKGPEGPTPEEKEP